MPRRSLTFVVISVLVVALVCGSFTSFTPFIVFAEAPAAGWINSADCGSPVGGLVWCCWTESGVSYCQTCARIPPGTPGTEEGGWECTPKEKQSLEQPPTPQPFDPTAPLQGGVLEQPPRPPPSGPAAPLQGGVLEQLEQGKVTPGFVPGFLQRQEQQPPADQGARELPPPATEQTQPATVEEQQPVPVCQEDLVFNNDLGFCVPDECPEGQFLDEQTSICVLEEQPVEQQEQVAEDEQSQPEGEQSSEESDQEGNNN